MTISRPIIKRAVEIRIQDQFLKEKKALKKYRIEDIHNPENMRRTTLETYLYSQRLIFFPLIFLSNLLSTLN